MSASRDQSSQRKSRASVLIVGEIDRELPATIVADRTVLKARDAFCAIGELACATAKEPIEEIIVDSSSCEGYSENVAMALRRVDPSVRLVLMRSGAASQDLPEGFDAAVSAPSDLSTGAKPEATRVEVVVEANRNGACTEATSSSQCQATDLGDTDLVEAMLHSSDGAQETALALMRQHTGWVDLEMHSEEPTSGSAATVEYQNQFFGVLVSQQAEQSDLKQWSGWLAKWLALDAAHGHYRHMAYHDQLTDAWNRRYFDEFLDSCMKSAAKRRRPVTVMVFDIDDFKVYNDTYGHAAGDEILRETVRLLTSVIRKGDRVCRIGGDEFAVIFADPEGPRELGSHHPESVEQIAQRFQDQICKMKFPKLASDAPATLSVSAGLATYPWDGNTPTALLEHADQLALQSKRRGKNAITLGPGAQQICRSRESDTGADRG